MNNQGRPDKQDRDPQAPKFMRPQRPVLDEPLEEVEVKKQADLDAREPGPGNEPHHEAPNLEATQEVKPAPESPGQAEPGSGETKATDAEAHSPYFPRGVYEDARSVEAYYGRGDAEDVEAPSPEKGIAPADSPAGGATRWLILTFAILMILVLLFLALTEGISGNIF